MGAEDMIGSLKIGFIGMGNLGQAILRAFLDSELIKKEKILISSRTEKKLQKVAEEFDVRAARTNEQVLDECDLIILAMKPQDLYAAIEPIASSFHEGHFVISIAAGISLQDLEKLIRNAKRIVRVMPNTAARLKKSVVGYSANTAAKNAAPWLEKLLSTLGVAIPVEDGEMMEAITVGASSGIGFIFELMIYWKEWLEEHGIDPVQAKTVTIQTFIGASMLAKEYENVSLDELQRKVTSLKGVTAAGLDSMRELEVERTLRISFEKAAMRDRELGSGWKKQV
jgi:pyrroline-5-carboxylate reductase